MNDSATPRDGDAADLAALVGSRLCHDLVSPLGAVSNGIELLELSGVSGEEIGLVKGAMAAALARVRFYRIAFGLASAGQTLAARELRAIVSELDARAGIAWEDPRDLPRTEARLACLALACAEASVPWGGSLRVAATQDGRVAVTAEAERLRDMGTLWDDLAAGRVPAGLKGAEVQFGLLAEAARALGRSVEVARDEGRIDLTV